MYDIEKIRDESSQGLLTINSHIRYMELKEGMQKELQEPTKSFMLSLLDINFSNINRDLLKIIENNRL